MNSRELLKRTAEGVMYNLVPYGILKNAPQGFDLLYDLKKLKSGYYPRVVFDVGANVGQTVLKWNRLFPKSTYHCFEPVRDTMNQLKKNTSRLTNTTYHQCALGAENKSTEITIFTDSRMNSIQGKEPEGFRGTPRKELIQIKTVDGICEELKINTLDFLKIDTEGFDIEVLKGAESMLKQKKITFLQVEAGMNPYNARHVPFQDFIDFLHPYGYILFGIYGQHLEWSGEKRLRMSNPVFIAADTKF